MIHQLPQLPYSYDALEPYIDEKTMEIHHGKHHATYVNNLNSALEKHPDLQEVSLADLIRNVPNIPEDIRTVVRNNGGGHYNHSLFWKMMKSSDSTRLKDAEQVSSPQAGGGEPVGTIAGIIAKTFGAFVSFKELFSKTAVGHFGSGWAWLSVSQTGELKVHSTSNQDSPIMEGLIPILGLDVWEHAYYLKYQNRRAEYVANWWNVVNWEHVEESYQRAVAR